MEDPIEARAGDGDVDPNGDLIEALRDALRARVDVARMLTPGPAREAALEAAFNACDRLVDALDNRPPWARA